MDAHRAVAHGMQMPQNILTGLTAGTGVLELLRMKPFQESALMYGEAGGTDSHRHGVSCRMENVVGRSVHLTPSGIDFDEHVFQLGQGTVVRAAGSLIFPRCPFA